MRLILSGADVFLKKGFSRCDIAIEHGRIVHLAPKIEPSAGDTVFDVSGLNIFPGFVDVHTHLREPGFFYKETIASGTAAAARGGFTTVCSMPNLDPCPDCLENLEVQTAVIDRDARIRVSPYGAVTREEKGEVLSDMEELSPYVCGFSDDGRGVQNGGVMEEAMKRAAALGKIIAAHCEDDSLLRGGYIHDGEYCAAHGHRGICPESEWKQLERDLLLAEKTSCRYHVCHVSTAESVELIRRAKRRGVGVTCETAPHYLTLDDGCIEEDGRFKMNPPLRSPRDREALVAGIKDGTVDIIATDHAPHSEEEKGRGLADSLMGVTGLETAFPVLYTRLVKTGEISLARLVDAISLRPGKIFGRGGEIEVKNNADLTAFDLNERYEIDPSEFLSKGKSTPFAGMEVYGRCKLTICGGRTVWQETKRK